MIYTAHAPLIIKLVPTGTFPVFVRAAVENVITSSSIPCKMAERPKGYGMTAELNDKVSMFVVLELKGNIRNDVSSFTIESCEV